MVVEEALRRVLAWLVKEWHRTGNRWARVDSDSSLARNAGLVNERIAGPAILGVMLSAVATTTRSRPSNRCRAGWRSMATCWA